MKSDVDADGEQFLNNASKLFILILKRLPRPGGEPGIFFIFIYFLYQLQCLRPLDYCAPHKVIIFYASDKTI